MPAVYAIIYVLCGYAATYLVPPRNQASKHHYKRLVILTWPVAVPVIVAWRSFRGE